MRLIKNIPIRILYPVFMFVGLFILILFQYHAERSQTLDKIRLTYMDNANIVGDNIQQILEFLLAKEHMEMVDKVIATYSAQENIELIALVDHRNVVVSSSKRELKGSIYDKPNKWKGCSMQDVRIVCIYKVLYAQNVEGAVHVVFNLEREFKEANLMLMKKFLLNVLVLSLITYILYLFTDSLIIKELDQILTFLKASSSKEGSTEKMSGDGKNEFATIKRAINEAWETIWKLANTDHLTGLYNRRKMESLYEGELLNAKRPIFMALIDLDNFKDINDLFGHDFGDMLLVEFSKRLLEEGKKRGFYAGRFGGDEFLLMGEAESHIGLREELESIKGALSEKYLIKGVEINISLSIGYSLKTDGSSPFYDILKECDIALYRGKGTTKNAIVFFSKEEEEKEKRKKEILLYMKGALDKGEFYLVYQPVFDLETMSPLYYEALLRWHSPYLGNVSPREFIPYAETSGFILELGRFVLERAIKDSKEFGVSVGINVSARQLYDNRFFELLGELIEKEGVGKDRIILEITETQDVMVDEALVSQILRLRSSLFRVALDDFGVGYSNITLLNRIKPDSLKIDMSIIKNLEVEEETPSVVKAIVDMASSLKIEVIAEGVDSESKTNKLLSLGVKKMQGFYFGKPDRINGVLSPS